MVNFKHACRGAEEHRLDAQRIFQSDEPVFCSCPVEYGVPGHIDRSVK